MFWRFQSTLSRRERPINACNISDCFKISIHALTKRATGDWDIFDGQVFISIHALTKRATFSNIKRLFIIPYFNPRSHEESDILTVGFRIVPLLFQSTLSRRERLNCFLYFTFRHEFQSTLSRRERQRAILLPLVLRYFNPRSHEESDFTHNTHLKCD